MTLILLAHLEFTAVYGLNPNLSVSFKNEINLMVQHDMVKIIDFLNIIQEVDALPLDVFKKINTIGFDLGIFDKRGEVEKLVENKDHASALKQALILDTAGDSDALNLLANQYEKNKDIENYRNVLTHFPKSHLFFEKANELLHENLLIISDAPPPLLEEKFKAAFNSNQSELACNYFHELACYPAINSTIKDIRGDAETFIKMANELKAMQKELKELRAFKESHNGNAANNNIGFFNG